MLLLYFKFLEKLNYHLLAEKITKSKKRIDKDGEEVYELDILGRLLFSKIKNIEEFFVSPFYSYFVRQPNLSLYSVRKLLGLHKKHYNENREFLQKNVSQITGAPGTKINLKTLEIFNSEKQKETLPIIPTYILFGIYLSNVFQEKMDT